MNRPRNTREAAAFTVRGRQVSQERYDLVKYATRWNADMRRTTAHSARSLAMRQGLD